MNLENYNLVYKDIMEDENNQLSINYLINKYEIKADEEFLNLLLQIKKNEYVSNDDTTISRLIKELEENNSILDLNQIIKVKEKIINMETNDNEKESKKESSKNNTFFALTALIILVIIIIFYQDSSKTDEVSTNNTLETTVVKDLTKEKVEEKVEAEPIVNVEVKDEVEVKPIINVEVEIKDEVEVKPIVNVEVKDEVEVKPIVNVEVKDEVDIKDQKIIDSLLELDKKEDNLVDLKINQIEEVLTLNNQNKDDETKLNSSKKTMKLKSLEEVKLQMKNLKYSKGRIIYNNEEYLINEYIFGFKIFKLNHVYVKLEDERNKIRKTYLFK